MISRREFLLRSAANGGRTNGHSRRAGEIRTGKIPELAGTNPCSINGAEFWP
jgi:hypothetical protein